MLGTNSSFLASFFRFLSHRVERGQEQGQQQTEKQEIPFTWEKCPSLCLPLGKGASHSEGGVLTLAPHPHVSWAKSEGLRELQWPWLPCAWWHSLLMLDSGRTVVPSQMLSEVWNSGYWTLRLQCSVSTSWAKISPVSNGFVDLQSHHKLRGTHIHCTDAKPSWAVATVQGRAWWSLQCSH